MIKVSTPSFLPPRWHEPESAARPFQDFVERDENGLLVLSSRGRPGGRRILYVNSYGGRETWTRVKARVLPSHHLWGCLELVRMGHEVALAEPLPDFYWHRRPWPHDLRAFGAIRSWLGHEGVVYCGHNVLYWLPFLRALRIVRNPIVSLLFGREPLDFARGHAGIVALNPAAAEHARQIAPRVKTAKLAWGAALDCFPRLPYSPRFFLSCGQTCRDHETLSRAAFRTPQPIRVIAARIRPDLVWPGTTTLITGGSRDDNVTYDALYHDFYAQCAAALIVLASDPDQYTGVGFTNLIEAMAMARPVIVTRTGALPTELDVQEAGCGLHVPANDPDALAAAIDTIAANPALARRMGQAGRALCERYYNIGRFAAELDAFFATL